MESSGGGNVHQVLVFASHDSVHAAAARALAVEVGALFVDRLANDLSALRLVAQYQVVEPVVVVVRYQGQVVLRVPRLMTAEALERDLHGLT